LTKYPTLADKIRSLQWIDGILFYRVEGLGLVMTTLEDLATQAEKLCER